MEHTENMQTRRSVPSHHPYLNTNGKIYQSIRPLEGGLLFDEMPAQELYPTDRELIKPNEKSRPISQSEYDEIFAIGWAAAVKDAIDFPFQLAVHHYG